MGIRVHAYRMPFASIFQDVQDFHWLYLIFICFIPIEIRTKLWLVQLGLNFYSFRRFQPKITDPKHIWGECIVYTEIMRKPHSICSNKEPLEAHL